MSRIVRQATVRARELRRASTPAEQALWTLLRRRPWGYKFRRQHPKGPFFLDFLCVEAKLVIEVDGPYHVTRRTRDQRRDEWLREHGFEVLHVSNDEALGDPGRILERIRTVLGTSGPLPLGEGTSRHGIIGGEGESAQSTEETQVRP